MDISIRELLDTIEQFATEHKMTYLQVMGEIQSEQVRRVFDRMPLTKPKTQKAP